MVSVRGLALCVAAAAALASPASAQQVGVNSAVNPDARGTLPGGVTRQLVLGQPVMFDERIATQSEGQTQILFVDESAMTIGPNSDLTIDEFVYDPKAGTGKLAASLGRGVFRFVGGRLSKLEGAVSLHSGAATIGIRGAVCLLDQQAGGRLDVYFVYGADISVTGAHGLTQSMHRPGFAITVMGPGAPPSPPYPAPPAVLAGLLGQLDGRPGGSGGTSRPPTNATVASSGISSVISGDVATSVRDAAAAQSQSARPVLFEVAGAQNRFQVNTVQAQGTPGIALLEGNSGISSSVPTPTGTVYPIAGFAEVKLSSLDRLAGSTIQAATATLRNGVLSATASNGALSFPLATGSNNFGPQGASGVFDGTNASFSGSSYLAPDGALFYAIATSSAFPDRIGGIAGGLPTVNLPTVGIGSYSGSVNGVVFNNGAMSFASGTFTNVYNFASNSGTFSVNNFDGKSFGGSVAAIATASPATIADLSARGISLPGNVGTLIFTGKLSGSGLTGGVGGAFFGEAASDVGGGFGVNNPSRSYKAFGLFGGHR
jgi:FecR protein